VDKGGKGVPQVQSGASPYCKLDFYNIGLVFTAHMEASHCNDIGHLFDNLFVFIYCGTVIKNRSQPTT